MWTVEPVLQTRRAMAPLLSMVTVVPMDREVRVGGYFWEEVVGAERRGGSCYCKAAGLEYI